MIDPTTKNLLDVYHSIAQTIRKKNHPVSLSRIIMKRLSSIFYSFLVLSLSVAGSALAQQSKQEAAAKENPKAIESWREFMNLPLEKRKEFGSKLIKTQNLFQQKRIFDTLESIDELEKVFPKHPSALNLKGACYVELRSFGKAKNIFQKILEISPENTNMQFNLAEIEFVTKNWQEAHSSFEALIPKVKNNKAMMRLCEFKLLLCKLKLERLEEAKALAAKYDSWDDSPFYYYARAALFYHENKSREAIAEIRNAQFVWSNPKTLSAWQDTLVEYGFVDSVYVDNSGKKAE